MTPEESHQIVQFFISNWQWVLGFILSVILSIYTVAMHKFKYDKACEDVKSLHTSNESNKTAIGDVGSKLNTILDMLSGNLLIKKKAAQSNSPVTYTDDGFKLLTETKFPDFFETNKANFMDLLSAVGISDEPSLDSACWQIMLDFHDQETVDAIKRVAYENGMHEYTLRKLCAIYLREELKQDLLPQIDM